MVKLKQAKKKVAKKAANENNGEATKIARGNSTYPRHSLEKALRIPNAILEQNAGK